ncbi:MAG TPA: cysteine--tRNA ligase, partial [Candidatus Dormibacteraeota bacterium]|nr:cysteine--tRNA ligase [Candidatus Dormibacteraeota bacterium]
MRLYDTAQREVTEFTPRNDEVNLYVCGITPYDSAHLGHAFTYHVFDVLTRRLRSLGTSVRSVRNVTDVDDDILRTARLRNVDATALSTAQVAMFERDMRDIGLLPVDASPLASQHVPEMVEWVRRLEHGGYAYANAGWVYFDTTRFPAYGSLSRLDRDDMIALSRERGADPDDPRKRDPLDFVLWQPSAEGEPRWNSPWSDGRPGWHIECTVLAASTLGLPVDIHGGGDDLIYPHHESEIAQAVGTGATPYARRWMHVAMVQLDGVKMSKSLGNLVFVSDLLQEVQPATVRLLLAAHHYRSSWSYEPAELQQAEQRRMRYIDAAAAVARIDAATAADLEHRYWERIDDDLDTPGALTVLDELATLLLTARATDAQSGVDGGPLLDRLLDVLGSR